MILLVPGIHVASGPTSPEPNFVRVRRSEPSSATETIRGPTAVLATAAIVPCGTTLISAELKAPPPPAVTVTVYLPIADALTTPPLPTDTPGPETAYVTGP